MSKERLTYKEFRDWCDQRACDRCWGIQAAIICLDVVVTVNKKPFWKREKFWKENFEQDVLKGIVEPIEKKIRELEEET